VSDGARLESQGKLDEALKAFAGHKDWDGAVRVAMALNRHLEAAQFCLEAQRYWDAAVCFQRGGALKECLAALLKVQASHPRYRQACVQVVRVASMLKMPLDQLSMWLMPFIGHAPAAPVEAEAMKDIADAFAATGKLRLALSIVRTVVGAYPGDVEAQERLADLVRREAEGTLSSPSAVQQAQPAGVGPGERVVGVSSSPTPRPFTSTPSKPPSGAHPSEVATGAPGVLGAPSAFSRPSVADLSSPSGLRSTASRGRQKRWLGSLLVEKGLLTLTLLERLTREQPELTRNELSLAEAVVASGLVKDVDVLKVLSEQSGIAHLVANDLMAALNPEAAKALTEDQARGWRVVPIRVADRQLHVAMEDPRDVALIDRLRFATRLKIVPYFTTAAAIRRATARQYQGYDPEENAPSWHGQLFNPGNPSFVVMEPFSDRVTGTREKTFDTGEFARREALGQGTPLASSPSLAPRTTLPPPPLPTASMPSVGMQFGERYRLDALLGEGGSASVFKALDLELNEPVAIKVFHPSTEREAETLIARFKLELSLSRSLAHPNITRLFDLGSVGPWRYLTMELLEGGDLLQKLDQARGPLPFREGFSWLEQTCLGLQAAHERDVVHRDIKPQNIFVTHEGVVKLMDFGIARKRTAVGVTMNGMIGGTPEYMSPEQINSFSDVTFATDLYALGITAYQLFTGKLPFDFPELTRVLVAQSAETPVSPRVHNPQIPELLERLILHMVEKDPGKRPESAAWVAQQFRALRTVTRG